MEEFNPPVVDVLSFRRTRLGGTRTGNGRPTAQCHVHSELKCASASANHRVSFYYIL